MISRVLLPSLSVLIAVGTFGCRDAEPAASTNRESKLIRSVFFLGSRSKPEAATLDEGKVLSISAGDTLAVFGRGDLGGEPWGTVQLTWDSGDTATFSHGGVVSWAPEGANEFHAEGTADVPLVGILLDAAVDGSLTPSSMKIRKVWRIPEGKFTLDGDQLGQQVAAGQPATTPRVGD